LNIRYYKTFIAVAESQGISKVSESLYLTQPAVTKQIHILEQEYNKKLFDRSFKEIRLTEEGNKLLEFAKRIVELYDESVAALSEKSKSHRGTIKIAANFTIGTYILPRFLKFFMDNFLQINVNLTLCNKDQVLKALKDGSVHLGFIGTTPEDDSILANPFYREKLTIVVGKRSGIKKITSLKNLSGIPFVGLHKGSDIRATYEPWFREKGIELTTRIELNNIEAIKSFLNLNMGFSILPWCSIEQDIRMGFLQTLAVQQFTPLQTFYLCHFKRRNPSRIEKIFLDFFADYNVFLKGI
jgi:DNA-binding transcriptional LysR family regulator